MQISPHLAIRTCPSPLAPTPSIGGRINRKRLCECIICTTFRHNKAIYRYTGPTTGYLYRFLDVSIGRSFFFEIN